MNRVMARTISLCLLMVSFSLMSYTQTLEGYDKPVYKVVDQMPVYPGGEKGLMKYLSGMEYPEKARRMDIEGTVYVRFVVNKKGKVTDVTLAKGSHEILDKVALKTIKKMGKWKTPGMLDGEPVNVQYVIPLKFNLN